MPADHRRFAKYLFISVVLFWVVIAAITLPNANNWLRGEGCTIKEDFVHFNRSVLPLINKSIPIKHGQKVINNNVFAIDNAPNVPRGGLQGILYDLGESCGNEPKLTPKSPFLHGRKNLTRIALIKQSENCNLADKIINAEQDGAAGVIIYQPLNNSVSSFRALGVMPKTVNIPAYYVGYEAGLILFRDVARLYNRRNTTDLSHSELMVRVKLVPSQKAKLDHWEFALAIIGSVLFVSLLGVGLFQFFMWRLAKAQQRERLERVETWDESSVLTVNEQRQLAADESFWRDIIGQGPPSSPRQRTPTRYRLEQTLVNLLPTRIFHLPSENDDNDDNDDEKTQVAASEKGDNVNDNEKTQVETTELAESVIGFEPSSCVICLENFNEGDILRRLPCCHEYHRDCIDVWLTKKSSSCPLCLACVAIPTVPQESHVDVGSPDLGETWLELTRQQAAAGRIHPFAYNRTRSDY